jgi:transcriptional regulator with XRE-family HTH domain
MRSKVAQRLLDKTPLETTIFVKKYGDLVVLINQILKEKGYTQKSLADKLGKRPSEISKWLNGEHNFTLRSLAKLEAELGETLLFVPKRKTFQLSSEKSFSMTVYKNTNNMKGNHFIGGKIKEGISSTLVA